MNCRNGTDRRSILTGRLAMPLSPAALHAADTSDPILGLIYPGSDTMPPKALDEAEAMYPRGVRIVGVGLGRLLDQA